jgi:hypothetical protein
MKALSLIEPWASLVAWGYKKIETRSWGTGHRGVIAIHASKSKEVVKDFEEVEFLFGEAGLGIPDFWPKRAEGYPLGKIVAVVNLFHCQRMTPELIAAQTRQEIGFGAWTPGRYAFSLGEARKIETPIPCRGALGLWEVPAELEAQAVARCA